MCVYGGGYHDSQQTECMRGETSWSSLVKCLALAIQVVTKTPPTIGGGGGGESSEIDRTNERDKAGRQRSLIPRGIPQIPPLARKDKNIQPS